MSEFALIEQVFARRAAQMQSAWVELGIGDDCALLNALPAHQQMAVSTDMLVEGTHFFAGTDAADIGYKSLAVNLSDLAAMGASPLGFTLALSLPSADQAFLNSFAQGLFELAHIYDCPLIGGDTTRGPLAICVTVFGSVARGQSLRRDAARVGQDIWVSGSLGAAGLAVQQRYANVAPQPSALQCLLRPQPRVPLGMQLVGLAASALDLSDGLYGDLKHIASASGVGLQINLAAVPIAPSLQTMPTDAAMRLALTGGDDYELAFTADSLAAPKILALGQSLGLPLTCIGKVISPANSLPVICLGADGVPLSDEWHQSLKAYEHF